MTCAIYIRSYRDDFDWLPHCLRSIAACCHDFDQTVVEVPVSDLPLLAGFNLTREKVVSGVERMDGYLQQQVEKMHADLHTNADYILHVDSDCFFHKPVWPESFFENGRPAMLMTPYSAFDPAVMPWQGITEKALGFKVEYEFMRRLPIIYPRWLYADVRRHMEKVHGCSVADYVAAQPHRAFSEFNVMGAFAYQHHRHAFHWMNTEEMKQLPDSPCRQFRSWDRLKEHHLAEMHALLP